jgi:hypothetical protein
VSWGDIDWGNTAQWVSGLVAGVALVLTAATIRSDRSARRRADAGLVYPMVSADLSAQRAPNGGEPINTAVIEVYVINGAPRPVFDITSLLVDWSWAESWQPLISRAVATLEPGSQSVKINMATDRLKLPRELPWRPPVEIWFRVGDTRWRRDPNAVL